LQCSQPSIISIHQIIEEVVVVDDSKATTIQNPTSKTEVVPVQGEEEGGMIV
jgi:hypothetical protein